MVHSGYLVDDSPQYVRDLKDSIFYDENYVVVRFEEVQK